MRQGEELRLRVWTLVSILTQQNSVTGDEEMIIEITEAEAGLLMNRLLTPEIRKALALANKIQGAVEVEHKEGKQPCGQQANDTASGEPLR